MFYFLGMVSENNRSFSNLNDDSHSTDVENIKIVMNEEDDNEKDWAKYCGLTSSQKHNSGPSPTPGSE